MLQHILLRSDISFFESIAILCSLPSQNFHSREFEIEYVWTKLDTFDTEIVLIILSKIQQGMIWILLKKISSQFNIIIKNILFLSLNYPKLSIALGQACVCKSLYGDENFFCSISLISKFNCGSIFLKIGWNLISMSIHLDRNSLIANLFSLECSISL